MFCVSVEPWFYSDTPICSPFSWSQRMLQVRAWGKFGILIKDGAAMTWTLDCGEQRFCQEDLRAAGPTGFEPMYYYILSESYGTHRYTVWNMRRFSVYSSVVRLVTTVL